MPQKGLNAWDNSLLTYVFKAARNRREQSQKNGNEERRNAVINMRSTMLNPFFFTSVLMQNIKFKFVMTAK